jgi:hypothetical protein
MSTSLVCDTKAQSARAERGIRNLDRVRAVKSTEEQGMNTGLIKVISNGLFVNASLQSEALQFEAEKERKIERKKERKKERKTPCQDLGIQLLAAKDVCLGIKQSTIVILPPTPAPPGAPPVGAGKAP